MRVDYRTDIGAVRESNQDACECGLFSPDSAWAVVCDGMGGANGGNIASSVALEAIRDHLLAGYREEMSEPDLRNLILNAVSRANEKVFDTAQERESLRGMGTTAVVMVASRGFLRVAHVGDSRAYLKRHSCGCVTQITVDHSYVQDLVNFGQITQEEARVHPKRNIITRALGVHDTVQADYAEYDFAPGDMALACSDGLSNYAGEEELASFASQCGRDGKKLVDTLIDFAVSSGGADNVTVAVINND